MEYAEFLQQFRERTAKRMEEFEKAIASTQRKLDDVAEDVEKKKQPIEVEPLEKPVRVARRSSRGRGPVKSVLREA
ncbi:hypothetical protein [Corynebacterium suranareeae]|nr:hypothetical protein [Corynebacterium suranareeae]